VKSGFKPNRRNSESFLKVQHLEGHAETDCKLVLDDTFTSSSAHG
jgi:hypothetical protein